MQKTQRICTNGHKYYKSTDCPVCPICEGMNKPSTEWLAALSAPSRRAMEAAGINSLKQLSTFTEKEVAAMHGVGPKVIRIMKEFLEENKLKFEE